MPAAVGQDPAVAERLPDVDVGRHEMARHEHDMPFFVDARAVGVQRFGVAGEGVERRPL